jgi:hypothetical protein
MTMTAEPKLTTDYATWYEWMHSQDQDEMWCRIHSNYTEQIVAWSECSVADAAEAQFKMLGLPPLDNAFALLPSVTEDPGSEDDNILDRGILINGHYHVADAAEADELASLLADKLGLERGTLFGLHDGCSTPGLNERDLLRYDIEFIYPEQ